MPDELDEMPDHELDEMPADELDEMQEDNDKDAYDIDDAHDSNVTHNAPLDEWSSMAAGTVEITTLYDSTTNAYIMNPHAALARRMVTDAFLGGFDTGSLDECVHKIQEDTNFTVILVERVMNLPVHIMQQAYESAYGIKKRLITYHGSAKVLSIAQQGFRGAACRRAKYGVGIYTGSNAWEALSYCPPTDENTMQILVVDNLVGLHTVGKQDQEDFGTSNTLTNPEETIWCSKNESQLCAVGIVTIQYRMDIKPTLQHAKNVVFYHQLLVQRIHAASANEASAPAGALVAPGARAAKPPQWVDKTNHVFGIGQAVDIIEIPDDKHAPYKGCQGVIRKSEAKDAGKDTSLRFYIQVALDSLGQPVDAQVVNSDITRINTGKFQWVHGMHRCCMRLNAKHISIIYGPKADAVRAAAEAAWVGGVGAPAAAAAAASAAPLEWVHKAHPTWLLEKEAIIKKPFKGKYSNYVGFKGVVKGSIARGGQYTIFVHPTHDQHGQPVSADTLNDIIKMHEKCFMFLKGTDRHIIDTLGCLPVLQNGLDSPTQAASKRPADGQPDELAGAKKARPAGGEAP
jgi:hypothetical protein